MTDQLTFDVFGSPEPLKPTHRFFFAVFPPKEIAEQISYRTGLLRSSIGFAGRSLLTERLHITLQHLGDFVGKPQAVIDDAQKAAASMRHPPFQVTFDCAVSFNGRRGNLPFVLRGGEGLSDMIAFQQTLGVSMTRFGLKPDRSFVPHVTLAYDAMQIPERAIAPISWTVNELVLIQSLLGRTEHTPLARWPLEG